MPRVTNLDDRGEWVVMSVPQGVLPASDLTATEREVATMIVLGHTNAEIANARGVSARTIANQVASILRKVGVRSRVELAALAAQTMGEA